MKQTPKHLHRHYRGKRNRIPIIITGIGILGMLACVGFIVGNNVPEEEISEAIASAALTTPSEDVPVALETPTEVATPERTSTPEPEPEPLYTDHYQSGP
jgi:hypothetical protein